MALDKELLGEAIYTARSVFGNKTLDELISEYGDLETAREAACKAEADAIITHFVSLGVINVTVATTGTAAAQTGTGVGKIS